ncbi:MAG: phage terminase large subunit [Lactobacillales bacterium]|jgi:hypothetical protein|nr:phage terminase large subunit [Lactobacillales bacterium]
MNITFYHKFAPLLDMGRDYHTYVLTGGRGSMKTGHACRAVLIAMMRDKKRVVAFREIMRSIAESLYAEFIALINTEFAGQGFTYDKQRVYHKNGSVLFFSGLKDLNINSRERLKGLSGVDICIIDEAQSVSKACFDVLLPTLRKKGVVLIAIYNRVDVSLPVEEVLFLDYDTLSAPPGVYFAEVNYPEIRHLGLISDRFVERAELVRQNRPDEYERDYLNKPRGSSLGKVVKYFAPEHIRDNIVYVNDLPIHLSMDFNVDPMMWVCCHKTADKLFVFDEIVLENATTSDAIAEFIRRYPEHQSKIVLNGDASGDYRKTQSRYSDYAIVRNALLKYGYETDIDIRRKNPPIAARVQAMNQIIRDDEGRARFFVHPKCRWLVHNLKNLRYKEGSGDFDLPSFSQIKMDASAKFLGHIFDAVSYAVEYYWPVEMK